MRNAKLLILAAVSVLGAVGCTIQTRDHANDPTFDFSDYDYYDKPFATSPDYRATPLPGASFDDSDGQSSEYISAAPSRVDAPVAVTVKADVTPRPLGLGGGARRPAVAARTGVTAQAMPVSAKAPAQTAMLSHAVGADASSVGAGSSLGAIEALR